MDILTGMNSPVVMDTDSWFSVRQVDQIIANYPAYAWYDPMISYPTGKVIDWGPVYPMMVATIAFLSGSHTQGEMIETVSWLAPLLSLLLIPLCFLAGSIIWDKRAGWIAAILIPVLGGEAIFRSFYGDLDHHILEMIFSLAFFVLYIWLIKETIGKTEILYKKPFLIIAAVGAGIIYYLGIMTMPTLMIGGVVVGITTILYALLSGEEGKIRAFAILNTIIFGSFIILYSLSGIQVSGWNLPQYSVAHVVTAILIIAVSLLLSAFTGLKARLPSVPYPVLVLGVVIIGIAALSVLMPEFITTSVRTASAFLTPAEGGMARISEMQSLPLEKAFKIFNIATILAFAGFILIIRRYISDRSPILLTSIIWAGFILFISLLMARFFYYGGMAIVILTAVALSSLYGWLEVSKSPVVAAKKKNNTSKPEPFITKSLIITGVLMAIIVAASASTAIHVAREETTRSLVTNDWIDALTWLGAVSPEPEVDYYEIYNKDSFSYPKEAYSILSWWDYGHWITALSKRIPVTTPFQTHAGAVATFLLADRENEAEKVAERFGARYIITTNDMIIENFPNIRYWLPRETDENAYLFVFYSQDERTARKLNPLMGFTDAFFDTMVTRLHVMDGSYIPANQSVLVRYNPMEIGGKTIPVMQNMGIVNADQAEKALSQQKSNQQVISLDIRSPVRDSGSLGHYRLIYESKGNDSVGPGKDEFSNIKIFERVKGYIIPGAGTIELPLITNQGREFTWQQKSLNGTFTLPYSTQNNPYDVRATSPYRIVETGVTLEVAEENIS